MKTTFLPRSLLVLCTLYLLALEARAQLEWRVSVKFILEANGRRPSGGIINTDQDVRDQIDAANRLIDPFGRGYRFRLAEITNLSGYSVYFSTDRETTATNLQRIASSDPGSVSWQANAINVYINAADGANEGMSKTNLIVMGHNVVHETFTHECGHYLGLCHTQGCDCSACADCVGLEDDEMDDTLLDSACWHQIDDLSLNFTNKVYANLNTAEQIVVSNTFNNIMSYHPNRKVLTSDQLDRIADTLKRSSRTNLTTGFTWFVDRNNTCTGRTGSSACATNGTGGPFQTVTTGVNRANTGDIVLLRPGNYNEPMTITKAVTLRATRGDAFVGKP